jgi:hypothetical protein
MESGGGMVVLGERGEVGPAPLPAVRALGEDEEPPPPPVVDEARRLRLSPAAAERPP